jgi:galactokinase
VNLIGEHIDYNDGFVLPMAIDRYVVIAAAPVEGSRNTSNCYSIALRDSAEIPLAASSAPTTSGWARYVEGVIAGFAEQGLEIPAFNAVIGSAVPFGGGLSSSAALEVATATLLEGLTGHAFSSKEKAILCQHAEHRFAGVPCGIMDQFSSVFGITNELMLIDCRTQEVAAVPFDAKDISVLITNSNVKHELNGGEYAERRSQCDAALAKLGKPSWRDVSIDDLTAQDVDLSKAELRRARHVVSEIDRTLRAADAFRDGDWDLAGQSMYASHESLRDDFEVSCDELDLLVEIAREIGIDGGLIGSRMTGGGFGGCTVSLVKNAQLDSVVKQLSSRYESATGIKPHIFSSRPGRGAHVLTGQT